MTKITLGLVLAAALASILVLAQTEVSFKKDVQSILDNNCTGCHCAKKQKAGLNLSAPKAYASIVQVPSRQVPTLMLIKPGDPDQSYFWQKLAHTAKEGSGMPKAFFGSKKLSEADMNVVKTWIQGGAKE
jgi:hypothetical protein